MATIVEKKFVDDLNNSEAAAETVPFSIDGMELEIDLSEANATRLRMLLAEFVSAARPRVAKPKGKGRDKRVNPETVEAREWWRVEGGRNGVRDFVAKGRIPADVMERFYAAKAAAPLSLVA